MGVGDRQHGIARRIRCGALLKRIEGHRGLAEGLSAGRLIADGDPAGVYGQNRLLRMKLDAA